AGEGYVPLRFGFSANGADVQQAAAAVDVGPVLDVTLAELILIAGNRLVSNSRELLHPHPRVPGHVSRLEDELHELHAHQQLVPGGDRRVVRIGREALTLEEVVTADHRADEKRADRASGPFTHRDLHYRVSPTVSRNERVCGFVKKS